jgi:hypothetical protein
MKIEDQVKLFGLNNLAIESTIRKTEKQLGIAFREAAPNEDRDDEYYPQFPENIRREAASMARHYEIFYCLETSIRQLIVDRLNEEAGADWWEKVVPEEVKKKAVANRDRESATGMTLRSDDMIDYTTSASWDRSSAPTARFSSTSSAISERWRECLPPSTISERRLPTAARWPITKLTA